MKALIHISCLVLILGLSACKKGKDFNADYYPYPFDNIYSFKLFEDSALTFYGPELSPLGNGIWYKKTYNDPELSFRDGDTIIAKLWLIVDESYKIEVKLVVKGDTLKYAERLKYHDILRKRYR